MTGLTDRFSRPATWLLVASIVAWFVIESLTRGDTYFAVNWWVFGIGCVFVLLVFAFQLYANAVYPQLPQALGGGRPRCASLDLTTDAISATTRAALAPHRPARAGTVRSRRVDIVFSRDETLFVRVPGRSGVQELRPGAVRAVIAC